MAGERTLEDAIEIGRTAVLPKAFTQPAEFRDRFDQMGIILDENEPVGAIDVKIIELELKRMAVAPKFLRQAARAIANQLRELNYPRNLFREHRGVTIEESRVGQERFYRRSDLSPEGAHVRVGAYQIVLAEEIERVARDIQENSAAAIAERNRPSALTVKVISTFTIDEYQKRVDSLKKDATGRVKVEEMPHDRKGSIESVPKIIQKSDALQILEKGLTDDQFDALIKLIRLEIQRVQLEDENNHIPLVEAVLANAMERIKVPHQDVTAPIYIPRDMIRVVFNKLRDLNTNPDISFELELEAARSGTHDPVPRLLIGEWSERYYKDAFEHYLPKIAQVSPQVGLVIEGLLASSGVEDHLKKLRVNGVTEYNGSTLSKDDLDPALSEVLLSDEVIAKAVLSDLIGELYPAIYNPIIKGSRKETNLSLLRYMGESFTLEQIRDLLRPKFVTKEVPQLDRLRRQISNIEAELLKVSGNDRNSQQRRKSLEGQIAQGKKKIASLESQQSVRVPITKLIREQIEQRLATEPPNPSDFIDAELSGGYQRAVIRYDLKKDAWPDLSEPIPDDFILGEESDGFGEEESLYIVYLRLVALGQKSNGQPIFPTQREQGVLLKYKPPALFSEGLYKNAVLSAEGYSATR